MAHRFDVPRYGAALKEHIAFLGFFARLNDAYHRNLATKAQRKGQAWMNALHEVAPELYEQIVGTKADCFYDDLLIPAFKDEIYKEENHHANP